MGRGGIPLRPPAGQAPHAIPPLIPGIPDGKAQAVGPLGARSISPALLEKLRQAKEQQPTGGGIEMGGEIPVVREIPEQPSALDYEAATPPVPEPQKVEEKRGPHDGSGGILDAVATTGMEFSATPLLARDDDFLADAWWLSDPKRRVEIDQRCEPIDWTGFTTGMDITQRVHMWTSPVDLWVKFRKVKADDEMMARRALRETYDESAAEREMGLLITTAAASVVQVGDQKLPPVPSPMAKPDLKERMVVFLERVKIVSMFDMTLLRDLVINYAWFVRRATLAVRGKDKGSLGNG